MARAPILIGIDAGTSVMKSVAFTTDGEQIAVAARKNSYVCVEDGGVEQDMTATWADAVATLQDLTAQLGHRAAAIVAVAITGQGDGTWLIDAGGKPVGPAWLWLDARGGCIARDFAASERHHAHYKHTGTGINTCQQSVQMLVMKQRHPEQLTRATTAFHCKDWLYFNMTGVRATDPSEASFTFGDFRTRRYSDAVIANLGLCDEARLLPPIVDGRTQSHPLTREIADLTGLPDGVPVVLGYVDIVATGVGSGLVGETPGTGCSILGSTGVHMRHVRSADDVVLNSMRSGYVMPLPTGDGLVQFQSNMAATLNIDWIVGLAWKFLQSEGVERDRGQLMAHLDDRVLAARAVSAIYHPYISEAGERGPFMEPLARAQFTGLHQAASFDDLMRAVFEGLAFAARDCFEGAGGVPPAITLTGGAARSRAMRLFLASALGCPVRNVEREEAGAAGAAMIAAVSCGIYGSIEECTAVWTRDRLSEPTLPDAALAPLYDEAFGLYRDIREQLPPIWTRLAALHDLANRAGRAD
ncbi:putative sugar kinase [Aurantimonas manganoxydans SI85-9A1]|uniref:Putative sugar kinase n=1 Tax=Aurantimonas manganoxydans (strain ATCC BAA-1229 / DSM 21871 / SI85-9A1) TaxID=287752 RepID=Q1YJN8_AURMS|nr:FGGY-family carbohydrate kinase [Aurantimonas manganoxydans]EAS50835.1 putative sugar kinase [Aurantimonas manganoxydans SI85-9A1]